MDVAADEDLHRIKVPLPKNINELNQHAAQLYGSPARGQLRLYHNGRLQTLKANGIPQVQDNDIIHVAWGDAGQHEARLPMSTQRADFVKHPPQPQQSPRKMSLPSHRPFHGASLYRGDFVQQPLSARRAPLGSSQGGSRKWEAAKEPTGTTTYTEHYPSHSVGSSSVPCRYPQFASSEDSQGAGRLPPAPFNGRSRYNEDFVLHPASRYSEEFNAGGAKASPKKAKAPPTFEGETTYGASFHQHQMPNRWRAAPSRPASFVPFTARTEHQHEYVERRPERMQEIYLEPHPLNRDIHRITA